ncbi:YcxB family protein [Streptomyces sp. NPDC006463]|uniref:YcxB family protein n=1 Tax=Streptomyces sp. NPDC006463 TaxID=3364746 RepID=UPI00368515B8
MDMNDVQMVELGYQLTKADMAQALRARDRYTAAGRRRLWLFRGVGTLALLLGVPSVFASEPVIDKPAALVIMGVLMWTLALFGHQLTARGFGGLLARAGRTRTVIDDSGFEVATQASTTRMGWTVHRTYAETADSFVLLSEGKGAVAIMILPKRGARNPADVDRVRAILDRNLKRL